MHNTCKFTDMTAMGEFCAALAVKGIAFTVFESGGYYVVEITGY